MKLMTLEQAKVELGGHDFMALRSRVFEVRSDGVSAWLSKELESGRMAEKKEYRPIPVRVGFGPISLGTIKRL